MLLERESNEQGFSEVRLVGGSKIMKNLELSFGRITKEIPTLGEVRWGLKNDEEFRIKNYIN